jgi:prolyl-tRNA synthetase
VVCAVELRGRPHDRDLRGGDKAWQAIKQGVPVRVEIGPRDIAKGEVFVGRRDHGPKEKKSLPRAQFVSGIAAMLQEIQDGMFKKALAFRDSNLRKIDSLQEFEKFFSGDEEKGEHLGGFAAVHWNVAATGHDLLARLKVTPRCIPLQGEKEEGKCLFTGQPSMQRVIFAKSY